MPRLAGNRRFIGPNFAAPRICTNRRQILAPNPLGGLKPYAGSIAASVSSPIAGIEAALHLSGAHDHEIATPDLEALRGGTLLEISAKLAATLLLTGSPSFTQGSGGRRGRSQFSTLGRTCLKLGQRAVCFTCCRPFWDYMLTRTRKPCT